VVGGDAPATVSLTFKGLNLNTFGLTLTDAVGAPASELQLIGSGATDGLGEYLNGNYTGTFTYSAATGFTRLLVQGAQATVTIVGPGSPTMQLALYDAVWASTGAVVETVVAIGSSISDTTALSSTGAQAYTGCTIKTTGNNANLTFQNCTFTAAAVLGVGTGGKAVFDGPSYLSWLENGGVASGTFPILVVGGFRAGAVPGAAINDPAGAAATLSISGTGASAAFANGGNWYTCTALAANTVITLADNAEAGDTLCITRTDTSGFTLTISDATAGPIVVMGGGPGSAVLSYNGVAWSLQQI
jgi:hypothetical protein